MNKAVVLQKKEFEALLKRFVLEGLSAGFSYMSRGRWRQAKVQFAGCRSGEIEFEISPGKRTYPINIQEGQSVGVSVKYRYGRFVFGTRVVALKPSLQADGAGRVVVDMPEQVEVMQRRSYYRVEVPKSLKVKVQLSYMHSSQRQFDLGTSWEGLLRDISVGGLQVVMDADSRGDFKKGQFLRVRFKPFADETPIVFSAQVRDSQLTADQQKLCVGMQIVGLEASPEGRFVLQRLCNIAERYFHLNQSEAEERKMQQVT